METVLTPPAPFQFDENSIDVASGKLSDSWERWKKGFKIYFTACELSTKSSVIQLNIFLHVIGEQCREILEQSKETTLEGACKKLDEHFKTKKNLTVERHKFFTRDQQQNESIDQYVFDLRKLAKTCEFGNLNDDLIKDRLVCGVISPAIRERLLREGDLTLNKALEICRAAVVSRMYSENIKKESEVVHNVKQESNQEESNEIWAVRRNHKQESTRMGDGYTKGAVRSRGGHGRGAWRGDRGRTAGAARSTQQLTTRTRSTSKCGRCGTMHGMNACPAYGKICLRCSKMNHFAKVCGVYFVEASGGQAEPDAKSSIKSEENIPERASWGRPLEFILACLGYAVGLGNVWRFPYLTYRNGGGAFLIPFLIMLVFIGLPLFFIELYIGQYTGIGPLQAFSAISPFFSGLGYCTLVVITLIVIHYMIIVAWTIFYTIVSVAGFMDWGSCENEYNTDFCYSGEYDRECRVNNTGAATDLTYYLRKCLSIGQICTSSGLQPYDGLHCWDGDEAVPWYSNITRTLASEEYYNERVLGKGDATWDDWGTIQWHLVGCLALAWLVAFLCVIKGIQTAGKVVYFTALFPYVMLTALLIRGVTLEGSLTGIIFYLSPKWETLTEARVWGDAASQIFYSFGVGCGSLVTLASYNKFNNNCHFDAIFVSFANFFTSIYAGFAIFSVLGFQAHLMGVSVDDVAESGPGLAFVAYPEALLQMPVSRLWAILFFFMLFILGLGSQFAGIEAINTAIVDRWPHLRKNYWMVTGATCFACFILGIPMCFSGGVYLFELLNWNTASWAILLIGMAQCVAVSWSYGIKRAIKDLASMDMKLNKVLQYYWMASWTVITPIGSIGVLIFIFVEWETPSYDGYIFPLYADLLGWAVGLSTLVLFPVGVGWAWYHGYRGKQLFKPTAAWKPNNPLLAPRSDSIVTVDSTHQGPYDNVGYIM